MKLEESIKIASELRAKGLTMNAIGQQLGVSRQRIHQILNSNIHMENERSKWTFGLSTRNIRIVQSLNLTTKQEVIDAIILQKIFPNMTKNFGIRSYFDLCEWANVQPPSNLTYPKRYHAIIHP